MTTTLQQASSTSLCYARTMNRVIDAGSGLIVEWDTDELVSDDVTKLTVPAGFTARIGASGVRMTYEEGRLIEVSGEDLDLSTLVPLDRKARQLVAHTDDGELLPPQVAPIAQRKSDVRSPEFLSEVAEAYGADGYQGVQDRFDVGRRQASRYISRARDAGLIER